MNALWKDVARVFETAVPLNSMHSFALSTNRDLWISITAHFVGHLHVLLHIPAGAMPTASTHCIFGRWESYLNMCLRAFA